MKKKSKSKEVVAPATGKERRIVVSETRSGKVIKEKYGSSLLWKKEFHAKHGFFVLEVRKMICNHCGHPTELSEPRKAFIAFGVMEIQTLVCELCGKVSEYKFIEKKANAVQV